MPTIKQKKVFTKLMETNGNSISKAMRGIYSENASKNPHELTRSKGWQELCKQHGLTDSLLLGSLVEDIKKKPQNRKSELELGFKVKGRLQEQQESEEKHLHIHLNEKVLNVINKAEEEIKKQLEEEI